MNAHSVTLTADQIFHLLSDFDKAGSPWSFVGSEGTQLKTLQLMVDGADVPLRIALHNNGTWTASGEIQLQVASQ